MWPIARIDLDYQAADRTSWPLPVGLASVLYAERGGYEDRSIIYFFVVLANCFCILEPITEV